MVAYTRATGKTVRCMAMGSIFIQMEIISPIFRVTLTFFLAFCGSLLLAGFSFKYVEKLFISYGRDLAKQFKNSSTPKA